MLKVQPQRVRYGLQSAISFFKKHEGKSFQFAEGAAVIPNLDNDEVRLLLHNEDTVMEIKLDRTIMKNMKKEFESADRTLKAAKGLAGYPDYQNFNVIHGG